MNNHGAREGTVMAETAQSFQAKMLTIAIVVGGILLLLGFIFRIPW